MRFLYVLAATVAVANAQVSGICFDNFDCFFSGGKCVKAKGKLLGSCAPKTKRDAEADAEEEMMLAMPIEARTEMLQERTDMLSAELDELIKRQLGGGSSICFDNFDCFFSGGNCVRAPGKFLGTCAPKGATTTAVTPTTTKKPIFSFPTGFGSNKRQLGGSGVCFDNFDCFFSGGNCVKASGKLLGTCAPKSATTTGAGPTTTKKPIFSFPTGFGAKAQ